MRRQTNASNRPGVLALYCAQCTSGRASSLSPAYSEIRLHRRSRALPSYTTRISDSQLMHRDASDNRDALMTSPQFAASPDNGPVTPNRSVYRRLPRISRMRRILRGDVCDMCQKTLMYVEIDMYIVYLYRYIDKIVIYQRCDMRGEPPADAGGFPSLLLKPAA
jgi:hypothetical protein